MLKTAPSELMRATMGRNRRTMERWKGIVEEVEALSNPQLATHDMCPPPRGT